MLKQTFFIFSFLGYSILFAQENMGSIERLVVDDLASLVPKGAKIEVLANGFSWSEGPVWVPRLNGVLFSDVPENKVYLWTESDGLVLFLNPSGMTNHAPHNANKGSNGLVLDAEGNLILCQTGDRRVAQLKSWLFDAPAFETLVDHYGEKWLNSPNDLVFNSDGELYFTDPPYGFKKQDQDVLKEISFNGIYRWSKEKGIILLDGSLTRPNGIAFSNDEKTLYIGNSDPKNPIIAAFDHQNGKLSNKRVFFDGFVLSKTRDGLFDGLKVHSSGNLFATGPGGVLVIDPNGRHLGTILTGKNAANCSFDVEENYLYITSSDVLARIKLK